MQLDEALRQISDIRQQMAQSQIFRGYRSITVAFSGVAGLAAAVIQPYWVSDPVNDLGRYLALWLTVALICMGFSGSEIAWRAFRAGPGLARQHSMLAVEQFLPSIVVGALLTWCVYFKAPQIAWTLPGLWSLLFGLGNFASSRLLPRQITWVASYYVLCGCGCLIWGQGEHALSPWLMGMSFGCGHLFCAAILYWTLERFDDSPQTE